MNIFECAVIKNMLGGGGGASPELLARIEALEARVDALEPGNLFNIEAFLEENPDARIVMDDGQVAIFADGYEYSNSGDAFPDLIEGKTYTFSCNVTAPDMWWSANPPSVTCGDGYAQPDDDYRIIFTFVATKPHNISFTEGQGEVWVDDPEHEWGGYYEYCPVPVIYYNIMVNEGTEAKPYKPYKG